MRKLKKGDALHEPCPVCEVGPDAAPVTVCKCRATTYYLPGDELSALCGDAQSAKRWAAEFAEKYSPRAAEFPLVAKFPEQWSALAIAIRSAQIRMHVKPYDPDNPQPFVRNYFMSDDEAARMAEDLLSKIASLDVTAPVQ